MLESGLLGHDVPRLAANVIDFTRPESGYPFSTIGMLIASSFDEITVERGHGPAVQHETMSIDASGRCDRRNLPLRCGARIAGTETLNNARHGYGRALVIQTGS